jgi:hypothetical protein
MMRSDSYISVEKGWPGNASPIARNSVTCPSSLAGAPAVASDGEEEVEGDDDDGGKAVLLASIDAPSSPVLVVELLPSPGELFHVTILGPITLGVKLT